MNFTLDTITERALTERNLISSGAYRDAYRVDDFVAKIPRPYREKQYGNTTIRFPLGLYVFCKLGITDINQYELEQYRSMMGHVHPKKRKHFAPVYGIGAAQGKTAIISRLVVDYDGTPSPTLAKKGKVTNENFWKDLGELEQMFVSARYYPQVFFPVNILVCSVSAEEQIPIFVDYKRNSPRTLPFQPWLIIPEFQKRKIQRRLARARDMYKG